MGNDGWPEPGERKARGIVAHVEGNFKAGRRGPLILSIVAVSAMMSASVILSVAKDLLSSSFRPGADSSSLRSSE